MPTLELAQAKMLSAVGDFDTMTGVVTQLSDALKQCPGSKVVYLQVHPLYEYFDQHKLKLL